MYNYLKRCFCGHLSYEHTIIDKVDEPDVFGIFGKVGACAVCDCTAFEELTTEEVERRRAAATAAEEEKSMEAVIDEHEFFYQVAEEDLRRRMFDDDGYIDETARSVRLERLKQSWLDLSEVMNTPGHTYTDEADAVEKVIAAFKAAAKSGETFKAKIARWSAMAMLSAVGFRARLYRRLFS